MGDQVNKSIALKGFMIPLLMGIPFMPVGLHTIHSYEQLVALVGINIYALYFLTLDTRVQRLFKYNPRPKILSRSVFGLLLFAEAIRRLINPEAIYVYISFAGVVYVVYVGLLIGWMNKGIKGQKYF